MLKKFLMMFAVLVLVSACSTTDDDALVNDENITITERENITDGPLAGIYDDPINSQSLIGANAGSAQDFVVNVGDRVLFGYDSYSLASGARQTLENQAQWLKQNSSRSFTIEGHADERGTREYNLALGERRANSVKNYLVALGVDPRRITVISYGKERPSSAGSNPSSWSENRRGVTVLN